MNTAKITTILLTAGLVLGASNCFATWTSEKDPFGGKVWRVTNSDTGQTVSKTYKSEKKANKAAKILNKADKSVMPGPNGEGDYRGGGELPK